MLPCGGDRSKECGFQYLHLNMGSRSICVKVTPFVAEYALGQPLALVQSCNGKAFMLFKEQDRLMTCPRDVIPEKGLGSAIGPYPIDLGPPAAEISRCSNNTNPAGDDPLQNYVNKLGTLFSLVWINISTAAPKRQRQLPISQFTF